MGEPMPARLERRCREFPLFDETSPRNRGKSQKSRLASITARRSHLVLGAPLGKVVRKTGDRCEGRTIDAEYGYNLADCRRNWSSCVDSQRSGFGKQRERQASAPAMAADSGLD